MNDKHVRSRMANTLKIMQDLIWLMNGATDQLMFWAFIIAGCFETCSYITQYALNCFSINPKDTKKFDTLYCSIVDDIFVTKMYVGTNTSFKIFG